MECAFALATSILALLVSTSILVRERRVEIGRKTSKKEVKRYVLFVALCEDKIRREEIEKVLLEVFVEEFGKFNLSASGLRLVYFDEKMCMGVIRVFLDYKPYVMVVMSKVKEVNNKPVTLIPIRTFGTLKSAIERIPKLPSNVIES